MNTTADLKATKLTNREARYLTSLAQNARYYRESLQHLQTAAQRDLDNLAAGNNTSGIGHQWLIEPATYHAALKANLEAQYTSYDMEDRDLWQELVAAAYKGEIEYFFAAE
jgi:hypothetical protein